MAVRLHPGKLGLLSTRLATFFIQSDPGPIFSLKTITQRSFRTFFRTHHHSYLIVQSTAHLAKALILVR